jgi:hypothetical protein
MTAKNMTAKKGTTCFAGASTIADCPAEEDGYTCLGFVDAVYAILAFSLEIITINRIAQFQVCVVLFFLLTFT